MNKTIMIICLVILSIFASSCAKSKSPSAGSQTHFLEFCHESCKAPYSCICNVCTESCESDKNCEKIANEAVCISSDIHVEFGKCATEKQHSESICDIQCKKDSDCHDFNKTFQCLSGFCRDKESATSGYADASRPIESDGDDGTTEVEPNPSSFLSASGDLIDCFLPADADYIPPRPEACSEGFVDLDCDGEMVPCPEGQRISASLDSACRICVPQQTFSAIAHDRSIIV